MEDGGTMAKGGMMSRRGGERWCGKAVGGNVH
jgi:hypothetical protein